MASMSNVIGYAQVEKIRVLRVALLEAHRRAATTIKAGATWSQIEAEEEQAAVILLQLKAILASGVTASDASLPPLPTPSGDRAGVLMFGA